MTDWQVEATKYHGWYLKSEAARYHAETLLDEARAVADRYRFIRNGEGWPAAFRNSEHPEPLRGIELDAAIDTAIAADALKGATDEAL